MPPRGRVHGKICLNEHLCPDTLTIRRIATYYLNTPGGVYQREDSELCGT